MDDEQRLNSVVKNVTAMTLAAFDGDLTLEDIIGKDVEA